MCGGFFRFLATVASLLSAFFAAIGLAVPYLDVDVWISNYSYKLYGSADFEANEFGAVMALIFGIAAMILATVSMILCIAKHRPAESVLASIARLIAGVLLFVLGIVLCTTI